ncbi:type II toxin-antitoxin system death-on-curing family toxin [uncultured Treponema sp.]|uniref:type II toxin-antitoxin system death-on-curing family toxin n=1 Tax=uncultured Treponema sp. TaxID=162155 RepID=UPI00262E3156|nr:type II toxin-antitoxin system death-on-curing family toxin [uncultured Treponema sp.]
MILISKEQVLKIHTSLIKETGGIDGIRDENLLDSALNSPFQTFDSKELYPEILDKAAQLSYSIIKNHPFLDGNKRIGTHIMLVFLVLNNTRLTYTQKELIDFGLKVADSSLSKGEIKNWIEKRTAKND